MQIKEVVVEAIDSNIITNHQHPITRRILKRSQYCDLEQGIIFLSSRRLCQKQERRFEPPVPTRADFLLIGIVADDETLYQEAVKGWTKIKLDLSMKEPMLYSMIWQYLSPESVDEIKHDEDYKTFSDANDPEGLWLAIIKTHKETTVSRVKGVIKRSARKQYQSIRQGGYESLISYRERFDSALNKTIPTWKIQT
jgi:hypothetical protein